MKHWFVIVAIVAIVGGLAVASGCGDGKTTTADSARPAADPAAASPAAPPAAGGVVSGSVVETMDAGGYTYVQVETGTGRIWAAAPERPVKIGDAVSVSTAMPMPDFHSDTLDRTFDVVYFTNSFAENATPASLPGPGMPAGHPAPEPSADVDLSGIAKAAGGRTVGEIYAGRQTLAGTEVAVRGRVVKFLSGIMGKNWIHVRDGSGEPGANDLTVTTQATVKVGDLITVSGRLTVDRDFGAGYRYPVIIEDATVTPE